MSIKKHGGVFGRNPTFNDVELEGDLSVDGSITASGGVSLSSDLTIDGNLTVNGDTTEQNVTTWTVEDPNITVGDGITTDSGADGGGITLKGATDKTITWVESSGAWTFNTPVETGDLRLDSSTISSATGAVVLPEVDVNSGTIDGTTIGATTPDSAAFTTASASGGFTGDLTGNADTASALETARTIALSGDVTGSTSFDGSGNVTISTALDGGNADTLDGEQGTYYLDHNNFTNVPDPTLTLSGDVTGSATFTDLGDATLSATVGDDSHNHTLSTITDSGTIASQDASSVSITGGTIDDTTIGGTTPNLGTFTDLDADEIRVDDGLVDAPTITFRNDPDTGIFRPQDGTLGFTSNGVGVFTTADAAGSDFVVLGTIDTYELKLDKSVVASGTTGNQTINKTAGAVNFDAGESSLTVTNSYVDAESIIIATVASNDDTMTSVQVVAASGSFDLYADSAPTAETRVNFMVVN